MGSHSWEREADVRVRGGSSRVLRTGSPSDVSGPLLSQDRDPAFQKFQGPTSYQMGRAEVAWARCPRAQGKMWEEEKQDGVRLFNPAHGALFRVE